MTDVLSPIFIRVGRRFVAPDGKPSVMRHIHIQNVRAESRSVLPSVVAGLTESPVEDVQLSNIWISVPIAVDADLFKTFPDPVPEDLKGYPENRLTFGTRIPAAAFYVRHAKGITMSDVSVGYPEAEARPAVVVDDVKGIRLKNLFINDRKLSKNSKMLGQNNSEMIEVID